LVNDISMKEFKSRRGLNQGDPMTPFLFLMVGEGISTDGKIDSQEKNLYEG